MSLVPTYVKADDGFFYKNPVLGTKDWFICFDDEDPPELVIKKECPSSPKTLLQMIGITFSNLQKQGISYRLFSQRGYNFKEAISYTFDLLKPLPVNNITKHEGKVTKEELHGRDCVFYDL